jgi:hypothetical protein
MIIYALKLRAKTRAIALVALVLGPPLRVPYVQWRTIAILSLVCFVFTGVLMAM